MARWAKPAVADRTDVPPRGVPSVWTPVPDATYVYILAMKTGLIVAALAGLALGVLLVAFYGVAAIGDALHAVGWLGLAAIALFHLGPTALCGVAWLRVLPMRRDEPLGLLLVARWVRDAVNNLAAIIPVGGEIAGTRFLVLRGVPAAPAAASTVVDLTAEVFAEFVFGLVAVALLAVAQPRSLEFGWIAVGLGVAAIAVAGFAVAQNNGMFPLIERLSSRLLPASWRLGAGSGTALEAQIAAIYCDRHGFAASFLLHLAAWLMPAVELWFALRLMSHPLSLAEAVSYEGLVVAIRSAGFVVPMGSGIQEGGYVLIGAFFGVSPQLALALSLLKRARDLVLGVPALIAWHALEARLLRERARMPLEVKD
jgi:putative membrane protein